MARFVNKPEYKWTREQIAARVNEILTKYIDFDNMAKNKDTPFEDQQIELDSLDLIEISMELERVFEIDLDLDKLNVPVVKNRSVVAKPKPEHTTDKDVAILMRIARPLQLKRAIYHMYGIKVPLEELRALKSFTDYQEAIRRAINNQNSK